MDRGEFVSLLGPSGCGKTTALRQVAGFDRPDAGSIVLDGKDITRTPPNRRSMGMVFQAYSLFPNMTARQNVEFGLRIQGRSKVDRGKRIGELLELVGLSAAGDRYPHQLSGGMQQRVALARAIAIEPRVLLLDEPLSALDAKVRVQLREEIRRIQLELGITTLYVTHDQEEALSVSDRVAVMFGGRIEQIGTPVEMYTAPATPFVAEFVGLTNRLPGTVQGGVVEVLGVRLPLVLRDTSPGPAVALIRPEAMSITPASTHAGGAFEGTVAAISFLGAISRVTVDLGDLSILVQVLTSEATSCPVGTRVQVSVRPDPVLITRETPGGRSTAP